jgi:anti-sigma factor RsiW
MHRVVEIHLESYVDGSLLPVRRREVESHLEGCPPCRAQVAELLQTHEWLRLLAGEEAPAPGFYNRVRLRITAEAALPAWPFWQFFPALGRQLAFAMTLLVLLLGAYVVALQVTERGRTDAAEMSLDAGVIRAEAPPLGSDNNANRERVMRAIVMPASATQGD